MDKRSKETVWTNWDEYISCFNLLFQFKTIEKVVEICYDNIDIYINQLCVNDIKSGLNILRICHIRNDDLSFILPTILITEEILRLKTSEINLSDNSDYSHILGQKIIRVTNIIIDNFKKKSKKNKFNMFLAASEINFPDFLIEIRHACTHKNLPSFLTLMYCVKYLFLWLKFNLWDKQFQVIIENEKLFLMTKNTIDQLGSNQTTNKIKDATSKLEQFIVNKQTIKYEYSQLFSIVRLIFECFCDNCSIVNQIVLNEKINDFVVLFKIIQKIEKFKVIVLFLKIINEKISLYVMNVLNKIVKENTDNDLKKYYSFINFTLSNLDEDIFIDIVKTKFSNVLRKIYLNLRFSKDFHESINLIYESFLSFIVKRFNFNLDYPSNISLSYSSSKTDSLDVNTKFQEVVDYLSTHNDDKKVFLPGTLISIQIKELVKGNQNQNKIIKAQIVESSDKNSLSTDMIDSIADNYINNKEKEYIYYKTNI